MATEIKVEVEFSTAEITAIQELTNKHINNRFIALTLQNDTIDVNTPEIFKGRNYVKQLVKTQPDAYKLFEQVGTVFWYTEQRTATSLTSEHNGKIINISDELLRDRLSNCKKLIKLFFLSVVLKGLCYVQTLMIY